MKVVVTRVRTGPVRSARRAADERRHDTDTVPAAATREVDEHTCITRTAVAAARATGNVGVVANCRMVPGPGATTRVRSTMALP